MISVDIYFSDLKRTTQNYLINQFGDLIVVEAEPIFSITRAERKDKYALNEEKEFLQGLHQQLIERN